MTGFLSQLVGRVQGTTPALRPKIASRFDPSGDDSGFEEISDERISAAPEQSWSAPDPDLSAPPRETALPAPERAANPSEPTPRPAKQASAPDAGQPIEQPMEDALVAAPAPVSEGDADPAAIEARAEATPPRTPAPDPEAQAPPAPSVKQVIETHREIIVETNVAMPDPPPDDTSHQVVAAPGDEVSATAAPTPLERPPKAEISAVAQPAPLPVKARRASEEPEIETVPARDPEPAAPPPVHLRIDRIEVNVAPPKAAPPPRRPSIATSDLDTFLNKLEGRS